MTNEEIAGKLEFIVNEFSSGNLHQLREDLVSGLKSKAAHIKRELKEQFEAPKIIELRKINKYIKTIDFMSGQLNNIREELDNARRDTSFLKSSRNLIEEELTRNVVRFQTLDDRLKSSWKRADAAVEMTKEYKHTLDYCIADNTELKQSINRLQQVVFKPSIYKRFINYIKGKFMGKSMKVGGGGRFAKLTGKLEKEGKSPESAKAIAASVGRKKYGDAKMQSMASKGAKRAK